MRSIPLARLLGATLLTFFTLPALAGRPLVTDDASVVAGGMCQVEAGVQRDPGQGWFVPACNVAGDWELGAGWGGVRVDNRWRHAGVVYAKTVFKPLTADGWGAGMAVSQAQVRSRDAARDRTVTAIASVPVASWAVVHANVGAIEHRASRHGTATWAAALDTSFGRNGWSVETFGEREANHAWQAGWRWTAVPDVLDVDAAWGVQHAGGARATYALVGLTWTFAR